MAAALYFAFVRHSGSADSAIVNLTGDKHNHNWQKASALVLLLKLLSTDCSCGTDTLLTGPAPPCAGSAGSSSGGSIDRGQEIIRRFMNAKIYVKRMQEIGMNELFTMVRTAVWLLCSCGLDGIA